jgi:hypothetical protein
MRPSTRHTASMRTAIRLSILCTVLIMGITSHATAGGPWWNASWSNRVRITAGAAGYARYDKAAESAVNFTQLLTALGKSGTLDVNSLRVIETNAAGTILDASVPFQFDKDADYNATSKASGTMVVLMKGTTSSSASRYYDVYFETTGGSFSPPSFATLVGIDENASDGGQAAFRVDGPGVSMYLQTEAGAISSMIDKDYLDWVDWNFTAGAGGTYRGIPNAIYPESNFHPGAQNAISTVLSKGPLKVSVRTVTSNNAWEARWEFYSRYATLTVVKMDHPYWLLYEGVPGGTLEPATDFMYRADGQKKFLNETWNEDMPGDEWVYFGDPALNRTLFFAHHENDAGKDLYKSLSDTMTVFGFGRDESTLSGELNSVPQHMTMGFINDASFNACRDSITSAYKPLTIALSAPEVAGPDVPVLVSPNDAATNVGVPAVLRWRVADRATGYRLQVATSNTFTTGIVVDDSTLTDTTSSVSALVGKTTYYWRVSSRNATGNSNFAASRSFVTGLAIPPLTAPADGATGRQEPVLLTWSAVTGATGYHVQVSTESGFTSGLVVNDAAVVTTQRSVTGLQASTLYYWRVAARDAGGDGAYSNARTFTTSVASPTLSSPADNATNQPLSLTLSWSALAGATFYHVQVATDAGFTSGIILDDASVTPTSRSLTGLVQSTRYYWRVSAGNAGGEGPFSTAWSFSTVFPAPVLVSPVAGATGQPVSIQLRWDPVAGAVHYHLQLASDSLFSVLIKNDTTITDSVRQVNGMSNATWYYWRVAAKSGSASSPFSATWSFRTIGVMPGVVQLVAPTQDRTFAPDSVRCRWLNTSGATRYWLEVGLDSLFALRIVDSTLTDSAKTVRGLLLNHTYWWKVRGGTAEGWGPYSEVRRFAMTGTTTVGRDGEIPGTYALQQNYPNPFNPSTVIAFDMPVAGMARLEVFNMLGESVGLLVDEYRSAGLHEARFDAGTLASGTYFYRLNVNGVVSTRRMLLLR